MKSGKTDKENRKSVLYSAILIVVFAASSLCACSVKEETGSVPGSLVSEESTYGEKSIERSEENYDSEDPETETKGKKSEIGFESGSKNSIEESKGSTEPAARKDWKVMMRGAVDRKLDEYWKENDHEEYSEKSKYVSDSRFDLIYIDDDEIPEIYLIPADGAEVGTSILFFKEGIIEEYYIAWSDYIQYTPKSGKILLYHGLHIPDSETVMVFPSMEELWYGEFCYPGWYDGSDHTFNGAEQEYRLNDKFVSEEDYISSRNEVLGSEVHEPDREYTYDELMEMLT